ncbi:MAG: DNA polymerase I [Phycisphaerales bacterium]|nr:DNA polymerase I [Phycisphaerales bacterium]
MSTDTSSRTVYLIDGHAQFFRAYHAIRSGMTSPVTHEPTNLTYGFVGMLIKLLREHRPDYLAVVIDVAGDRESFRSELYPAYKAHRDPPPEDFGAQVDRCLEILRRLDIPVVGIPRVEADDVLATIARRLVRDHADVHVRIVSRDKDLTQLIDDRIDLYDAYKDELVTPDAVFKTEGVRPDQVVDVLALMGDTVDNVPGVPGIGPKTAGSLIVRYGTLDGVLEHIEDIKGKRRENLEASRDVLALSRQLVTLKDDCDVAFDLDDARLDLAALPAARVGDLFHELGFSRHRDELAAISGAPPDTVAAATATSARLRRPDPQGGLFDTLFATDAAAPAADVAEAGAAGPDLTVITSRDALVDVAARLRAAGAFALDVRTDGPTSRFATPCGLGLAVEPGAGWYVPLRAPATESLPLADVVDILRGPLEDPAVAVVGHDVKLAINVLRAAGVTLRGIAFDTMVASYIADATRSSHTLDVLAVALLGRRTPALDEVTGSGRSRRAFAEVALADAAAFSVGNADLILALRDELQPLIAARQQTALDHDLERPLIAVLAELEWNGIRVDPDELDRQREALQERIVALRDRIVAVAPHEFSPDSPKQLAAALFNPPDADPPGLGLKIVKRGKTGPSTDVEVLEKLAADESVDTDIPALVVEYRQLTKLVNTYLGALKEAIRPETGRVHASFHQAVAATGRLSSSDPNLQNIPIRTDVGRQIRRAFVAAPGEVLITADYSQIELRILAHLSGDPALIEAFEAGLDIHRAVAAQVYGVPVDAVTSDQRGTAKMVNFGIVYGITPYGLARRLGPDVSVKQAGVIIDDYKARFARISEFLGACVQSALDHGYVETMLGRRRLIPEIRARNPQTRAFGERTAINTVVQGSAADLIKLAMVALHARLPARFPAVRMLLQIHDELVFEAPESDAPAAAAWIGEIMESSMSLRVPLVVDAAWSTRWIDAK